MIEDQVQKIFQCLEGFPFSVHNEKLVQQEMETLFQEQKFTFQREHRLSKSSIIDFMFGSLGVEVKVKGGVESIYKQCQRYCEYDEIEALLLVSARSMGFPPEINNKPCYFFNLNKALL